MKNEEIKGFPCKMVKVVSSNIKAIGCDKEWPKGHLFIKFNTGAVYCYWDITKTLWNDFKNSKSIGAFFHNNIKTNESIKYKRMNELENIVIE